MTNSSKDEPGAGARDERAGTAQVLIRSGLLFIVIPILLMLALKYLLSI
jgi:hypothetical protein